MAQFAKGDRVRITKSGLEGTVRFVGHTEFMDSLAVGVALDTPNGKHSGSARGVSYFTCAPMHGIFCRQNQLEPSDTPAPPTLFGDPVAAGREVAQLERELRRVKEGPPRPVQGPQEEARLSRAQATLALIADKEAEYRRRLEDAEETLMQEKAVAARVKDARKELKNAQTAIRDQLDSILAQCEQVEKDIEALEDACAQLE